MTKKKAHSPTGLRLNRLDIKNYKKLDSLVLDFPSPLMSEELDIFVFGSKNGGGKTSVLECCSLLMLAGAFKESVFNRLRENDSLTDIANLVVKAGYPEAHLIGEFERNGSKCKVSLTIKRNGPIKTDIAGDESLLRSEHLERRNLPPGYVENALACILAFSGEPLIAPPLLHFNSYRKIQESNPELGMMAEDYPTYRALRFANRPGFRSTNTSISFFKLEILRSLMGQASLFEGLDKGESESVLSQLNSLIDRYCGGRIEGLRPLPDNRVDIRIKPRNSDRSFSFDGLSSGQKEMIATLFLIWKNTQEQPSIVLIDEPELHLNAEWHGDFVVQLSKLAPDNQYILATHSEEIFRSVDEPQRAVLVPNDNGEAE